MKKVIFFNYQSLTQDVYDRFYVKALVERGIQVEYWDLTKIFFPNLYNNVSFNNIVIHSISSFKIFNKHLKMINKTDTLFVSMITYEWLVIRIFRLLTKHGCKICIFARGMIPMPSLHISKEIIEKILTLNIGGIVKALKNRLSVIAKKIYFVKPYDYVFTGGRYGIVTIGCGYDIDMRSSQLININTVDFDRIIHIKGQEPLIKNRYAVFVDEYVPYHPDAIIVNMETPPAEVYYREINIFFDLLEKQYELDVVIAAHPKALKYHEENPFNKRKIIFSKTPELIKDAQFMMTHYSTCVGIATLFKVPMVFLASEL